MSNYDDVIMFKSSLKNYERIKIQIGELIKLKDKLEYEQAGVKGLDPSREPSTSNIDRGMRIISFEEPIKEVDNRIHELKNEISFVDKVLDLMNEDDREMVINIYVNNVSYDEMAKEKFYTDRGLKKKVNQIIKCSLSELLKYDILYK